MMPIHKKINVGSSVRITRTRPYRIWPSATIGVMAGWLILAAAMILMLSPVSHALTLPDVPLITLNRAAPPGVMFLIDDSGSMDWEMMTEQNNGLYVIGGVPRTYVFDDPNNDNNYASTYWYGHILTGTERALWQTQYNGYNRIYYDPTVEYEPWPSTATYTFGDVSTVAPPQDPVVPAATFDLTDEYVSIFKTPIEVIIDNLDAGFTSSANGWASASDTALQYGSDYLYSSSTSDGTAWARWTPILAEAGTYEVFVRWVNRTSRQTNVSYDIVHNGGATTTPVGGINQQLNGGVWTSLGTFNFLATGGEYVDLDAVVSGVSQYCADAVMFRQIVPAGISIKNAHYYVADPATWTDTDTNGVIDASEADVYLVNFVSGVREIYLFTDANGDNTVDWGELTVGTLPSGLVVNSDGVDLSDGEDLQNFANWYSYYRRRELTAKAAIARSITSMSGVKIGLHTIHQRLNQPVLAVKVQDGATFTDNTDTLLDLLYGYHSADGTPLRLGLQRVGRYFHQNDGNTGGIGISPYETIANGGECQQMFTIAMTDGYWNGGSPGVGNVDGDNGAPYADSWSATVADVAMYYYENDLSSGLADDVPTAPLDSATHQHMVTYGVSFGVEGTLSPTDYDPYNGYQDTSGNPPVWPTPFTAVEGPEKVDDLFHAAVNGRGEFLNAGNADELVNALAAIMKSILKRTAAFSSVAANGQELTTNLAIYQPEFNSDGWVGDLKAYSVNPDGSVASTPTWSAQAQLDAKVWTTRIIATYDVAAANGIPFRYANLTPAQQAALDVVPATAQAKLDFIRGDQSNELSNGGAFRNRVHILGDIVHSAPYYHDGLLYLGANDGMLHVFDASNGNEIFAYVPSFGIPFLTELTNPAYSHRFFVDLPITAATITSGTLNGDSLLVGGLRGGGKGYFCLNVSSAAGIATEAGLANRVKWEYPRNGTPAGEVADLGFSYSNAIIAESNDGWVVIFGNGYNSANGHAVLFILDAATGALKRSIDTGVGGDNGLATPIAIDVDNDFKLDYVYGGDLHGNLWKFDLTSSAAINWEVAYGSGGTPQPVFTARDSGSNAQPITTPPDVMFQSCDAGLPGYMVLFGTGKYLEETDLTNTDDQTMYGIWDFGDDSDSSEYLGAFTRPGLGNQAAGVTLVEQTLEVDVNETINGVTKRVRVLTDNPMDWTTQTDGGGEDNPAANAGWFFDLPESGERLTEAPGIRDGRLFFISWIPNADPCASGGDSIYHESNACSGGRVNDPVFDIRGDGTGIADGRVDEHDLITVTDAGGNLISVSPTGIWHDRLMFVPRWVDDLQSDTAIGYAVDSQGNIIPIRDKGERLGVNYWREW